MIRFLLLSSAKVLNWIKKSPTAFRCEGRTNPRYHPAFPGSHLPGLFQHTFICVSCNVEQTVMLTWEFPLLFSLTSLRRYSQNPGILRFTSRQLSEIPELPTFSLHRIFIINLLNFNSFSLVRQYFKEKNHISICYISHSFFLYFLLYKFTYFSDFFYRKTVDK